MTKDKLEILSTNLLDQYRPLVNELRGLENGLLLEFGWHYLLDFVWTLSQVDLKNTKIVLDSGAGVGVMQWYLASKEIDVLSVDRGSRADMYYRFRVNYRVKGLRTEDMNSNLSAIRYEIRTTPGLVGKIKVLVSTFLSFVRMLGLRPKGGQVFIYNQDLKTLTHIEDESVDAVIAVSALEHNSPGGLREVVKELMRVLKPGGKLLATLGAARDKDWFHDPSKGWNYSESTMRDIFDLDSSISSNYNQHDDLLAALKDCTELRDNLAGFYSQSGDNGMPWGKWDPQYIPVGVCKVKA